MRQNAATLSEMPALNYKVAIILRTEDAAVVLVTAQIASSVIGRLGCSSYLQYKGVRRQGRVRKVKEREVDGPIWVYKQSGLGERERKECGDNFFFLNEWIKWEGKWLHSVFTALTIWKCKGCLQGQYSRDQLWVLKWTSEEALPLGVEFDFLALLLNLMKFISLERYWLWEKIYREGHLNNNIAVTHHNPFAL